MARVKRGVVAHARHKKVLRKTKGYQGRSKNVFRVALERLEKGLQYSYRDRKKRKSDFRALWIQRINAASRQHGLTYSTLMNAMSKANIKIDRKNLSDLAIREPKHLNLLLRKQRKFLVKRRNLIKVL